MYPQKFPLRTEPETVRAAASTDVCASSDPTSESEVRTSTDAGLPAGKWKTPAPVRSPAVSSTSTPFPSETE